MNSGKRKDPSRPHRRRGRKALALATALAGSSLLLAPVAVRAQGAPPQRVQTISDLNIDELKRMIQLAKESGFTEQQIKEITVEDETGKVVNAWQYLQDYEKRQKEEAARKAAERKKVYLTPQEITAELDKKQPQELDQLRDKLLLSD
jgi:hypothetical protein